MAFSWSPTSFIFLTCTAHLKHSAKICSHWKFEHKNLSISLVSVNDQMNLVLPGSQCNTNRSTSMLSSLNTSMNFSIFLVSVRDQTNLMLPGSRRNSNTSTLSSYMSSMRSDTSPFPPMGSKMSSRRSSEASQHFLLWLVDFYKERHICCRACNGY